MRWLACVAVVLASCSNILGLSSPQLGKDAAVDAAPDAPPPGDFTFQVTTPHPRVPAGGFDFLDVSVTTSGVVAPIQVTVPQPPQGVTVTPATLAPGTTTGALRLDGQLNLIVGATLALHVVASNGAFQHAADLVVTVTLVPGTLDTSFGGSGSVTLGLGGATGSFCSDLGIGSDGAITVFGGAIDGVNVESGAIQRLFSNGTNDPVFAAVKSDQGDPDSAHFNCGAVTSDNGVVAGGQASDSRTDSVQQAWFARFSATGAEVKPFGDANGFDFFEPNNFVTSAAVTPSGALVITLLGGNTTFVARQTGSGVSDPTFAAGGLVNVGLEIDGSPQEMALDAGGSNVYITGARQGSAGSVAVVAHIDNAGKIDAAFGSAADAALAGFGTAATIGNVVAVEPDGSLLVAGTPPFLVHLSAAGALDTSFGSNGLAIAPTVSGFFSIGLQSDGKIVVYGQMTNAPSGSVLARFTPTGQLDPTYGTNGIANPPVAQPSQMRIQSDDSTVACGSTAGRAVVTRIAP